MAWFIKMHHVQDDIQILNDTENSHEKVLNYP